MVKKILMLVLTAFVFTNVVLGQDTDAIKQQIEQTAAKIQTMDCDFVQIKYLKMLNEKMVSKGRMSYSQPGKLRWEYLSPYSYIFILNNNKVIIKNEYRSDEIEIQNNKIFKEIVRLMMNTVVGKSLSDDKKFKVEIEDVPNEWIANLIPQGKDMKQMFKKIILHFNKEEKMVSLVEIFEKNDDKTHIELKNVQLNKHLDDKIFTIHN